MGLDGGTIISRSDVLRGQSWEVTNAQDDSRSSRGGSVGTARVFKRKRLDRHTTKVTQWTTCTLSGAPLEPGHVVACFLGRLYNRAAVLEWLLARAGQFEGEAEVHRYANQLRESGDAYDHLTSIRDVFDLQYAPATDAAPAVTTGGNGEADPMLPAPYSCPVTFLRCDRYPFSALTPCGHVFADRALKEATSSSNRGSDGGGGCEGTCPTCSARFSWPQDVVALLPGEEELEAAREALPARRERQRQRQKQRKKQKH